MVYTQMENLFVEKMLFDLIHVTVAQTNFIDADLIPIVITQH
jgi:hypothetical protein